MILRLIIMAILMGAFHLPALSANNDTIVNKVFTLIYNQQFNEAESLLATKNDQLDSFYADILYLDLCWWKFSISRSREDSRHLNNTLKDFGQDETNTQEQNIKQLIQKSYQLRYELKRYNILAAAITKSQINTLLAELNTTNLSIAENRMRLFDLYMAFFHYSDNVINPFLIERKTDERTRSLQLLEKYTQENDLIIKTLAHYFLGRIYMKMEKEPQKGKIHFKFLTEKYPGNPLFDEYLKYCSNKN